MNKCLVTKLNGVVSNKNLTPLGCVAFTAYPSDNTLKLECNGNNVEYFTADGEAVFSTDKSTLVNRISANQPVFVKTNKPTLIFIYNKYELTKVSIYDSAPNSQIDIDFNDFKYCKKVEEISLAYYRTITGDISSLSSLTNLQKLNLRYTSISGDISSLSLLTNLQELILFNTSVSGDISSFNNMIKLNTLKMGSQGNGYFKTLCNSLKDNGKTSGTLTFWAYDGQIKIDEQTECPNNDVIATFSEGEISYSGL